MNWCSQEVTRHAQWKKDPNKKQADPQTCGLSALRFNTFTLTLFMLHNVFCSSAQTLNLCSLLWNYDISHGIDAENRGGKHAEQKWDFGIRLWRCVIFFQPWKLIWVCPVRAKIWRLKTLEMYPSVHPCIFLRAYLSWGQWVGLSCHRWLPAQLISHHSANPEFWTQSLLPVSVNHSLKRVPLIFIP